MLFFIACNKSYCFWVPLYPFSLLGKIPLLCFEIELHYFSKEHTRTFFPFRLSTYNLWRKILLHFPLTLWWRYSLWKFSEQNFCHFQKWRSLAYLWPCMAVRDLIICLYIYSTSIYWFLSTALGIKVIKVKWICTFSTLESRQSFGNTHRQSQDSVTSAVLEVWPSTACK